MLMSSGERTRLVPWTHTTTPVHDSYKIITRILASGALFEGVVLKLLLQ